jgi:hypothetical protein
VTANLYEVTEIRRNGVEAVVYYVASDVERVVTEVHSLGFKVTKIKSLRRVNVV